MERFSETKVVEIHEEGFFTGSKREASGTLKGEANLSVLTYRSGIIQP